MSEMSFRSRSAEPSRGGPLIPLRSYNERFTSVSSLGSGSFGVVNLTKYTPRNSIALEDPGKAGSGFALITPYPAKTHLVAVKTMKKVLKVNEYDYVKEVRFIRSVPPHRSLVSVHEVFIDIEAFGLNIVMECMHQNLYQFMKARNGKKMSNQKVKHILSQILAGIKHIHDYDFFHRDIKPENILILSDAGTRFTKRGGEAKRLIVKLGDFGLSRCVFDERKYTEYVSTRWYRSPEILLRKNKYGAPVDIWAFAILAVEIANLAPLFPGQDELDQIWKIYEVLGSPYPSVKGRKRNSSGGGSIRSFFGAFTSLGHDDYSTGKSWNESVVLCETANIKFPDSAGQSLESLVPTNDDPEFIEWLSLCLLWDPNKRITAAQLMEHTYFKGFHKRPKLDSSSSLQAPSSASSLNGNSAVSNLKAKHCFDRTQHQTLNVIATSKYQQKISGNKRTYPFDHNITQHFMHNSIPEHSDENLHVANFQNCEMEIPRFNDSELYEYDGNEGFDLKDTNDFEKFCDIITDTNYKLVGVEDAYSAGSLDCHCSTDNENFPTDHELYPFSEVPKDVDCSFLETSDGENNLEEDLDFAPNSYGNWITESSHY